MKVQLSNVCLETACQMCARSLKENKSKLMVDDFDCMWRALFCEYCPNFVLAVDDSKTYKKLQELESSLKGCNILLNCDHFITSVEASIEIYMIKCFYDSMQ